jgi:hypothetical protein
VAAAPVAPRGASAGLFAVAFRSAASGVAVGGDYRVARTGTRQIVRTDDGVRWLTADAGEAAAGYWSGLAYVPGAAATAVVAVGGAGTAVSRDDGRTWAVVDTATLHAVAFAAPDAGWAVGPGGRVVRVRRAR